LHGDVLVSFRGTRFNAVDMGLGYIAIIISAICYGCNPLFSAMGTELGFSVPWQLAIRFLGTSLPIGMYLIVRKRPLLLPWKTLWRILLSGIGTFGMTSVLLYESYRFAPSGMDTTIHFLYPVFVMVLSVLMGREKPQWRLVVAVVIALVALLCIIQPWTVRGARGEGVLLALASSLTFSCYVLFLGRPDIREGECVRAGLLALSVRRPVLPGSRHGRRWTVGKIISGDDSRQLLVSAVATVGHLGCGLHVVRLWRPANRRDTRINPQYVRTGHRGGGRGFGVGGIPFLMVRYGVPSVALLGVFDSTRTKAMTREKKRGILTLQGDGYGYREQ
jgi:uncharacterized membrane protein